MAMSLKSPATKFIGVGGSPKRMQPGKVPIREPEGRATSAKIGDRKRRQLEGILEKEKNKERRERVAYVLIQKLIFKFGSKFSTLITVFVEEYFNSHEEISSNDIAALEQEIRAAIKSKMESVESAKGSKSSRGSEQGLSAAGSRANTANNSANNQPQSDANASPLVGHEWQMIQVYQSIQDEEKIKREREFERQKKENFRAALDRQRMQSKQQNSAEIEDERKYVAHIVKDIAAYHNEEQEKRMNIRQRNRDELMIRKAQIDSTQQRLTEEKQALLRVEIQNLQLADAAVKQEAERIQRSKQLEKSKMEVIKKENEENKRLRQIEKDKEAQEDFRLMQEYAAKLDREAKERDEAFANRMKTMEIHGMKFANEGAGKAMRDEQVRFEQQLLREQQRKHEADHRREVLKQEEKRRNLQLQMDENRRQLEKRRLEEIEEKERDAALAAHFQRETEAFRQDEQKKMENYRRRQTDYRRKLDEQADDWKRRSTNLDNITKAEKEINHEILDDLATPTMLSKVMHRVRMDTARAKTAK